MAKATKAKGDPKPKVETSKSDPRSVGRPTLYRPEYCQQIVDFCARGFSIGAWCGEIDVARSNVNVWAETHPEFSEAVSRAKAKCLLFFEKQNVDAAVVGGAAGRSTIIMFALKNMGAEDWRDRSEVKHEIETGLADELDRLKTLKG